MLGSPYAPTKRRGVESLMPQDAALAHDINLAILPPQGDVLLGELNQLRDHDPLYWSEQSHCWIASGHAVVAAGFGGQFPLSNQQFPVALYRVLPKEELERRIPNAIRYMTHIVTNSDGEQHMRLRKLMMKGFTRKLVDAQRPFVQARVASLLDRVDAGAGRVEFNEQVARMLPGAVILKLLGMDPDRYLVRLKAWADAVNVALGSFNPLPEWLDALEDAVIDMVEVFKGEIEDRRRNPGDDLISALLAAVEGEATLAMDEMLGSLILVIVAGHDTTSNSLTLGVRALAANPDAWAHWRAHGDEDLACTNELMRYIAMSTTIPRIVTQDFVWEDRQVKAGQLFMLMIAGGNRDPAAYAEPERLDFTRSNEQVLTFGPGLHHCIGHLLAKLQLSEFFSQLVRRYDGAKVVTPPPFMSALVFRGVSSLDVQFS